jgi:hypothetical protein
MWVLVRIQSRINVSYKNLLYVIRNIRTNCNSENYWLLVAVSCLRRLSIHKRLRCCRWSFLVVGVIVILRPTVSRPVYLGIKPSYGAYDQIFITVRQLRVCWYGTPSMTRGRVCRLQLLLSSPGQSLSGPSPAGLMTTFYCLRFENPPTWRTRSLYLYPPGTGWPGYTPRHWVGLRFLVVKVKVMLRPTVSRPVCLGIKHPPGT